MEHYTCGVCYTEFGLDHTGDNDVKFCPFCGEDLEEVDRHDDEDDED